MCNRLYFVVVVKNTLFLLYFVLFFHDACGIIRTSKDKNKKEIYEIDFRI